MLSTGRIVYARGVRVGVLVWLLFGSAVVHAQPEPTEPPEPSAEEAEPAMPEGFAALVREGLAEYGAGRWAEARVLFLAAYEARESAEALRMAGNASYELRDYVASVEYLERALAATEHGLRAERAAEAEVVLERARRFVGVVRFEVTADVGARVRIDGREVDVASPLLLAEGTYRLRADADGHLPIDRPLDVHPGEQTVPVTLSVEPEPDPVPTPREVAVMAQPAPEPEPPSRVGLWVGLSGAAVAVAVLVVVLVLALGGDSGGQGLDLPPGENTFGAHVEALR